MSAEVITALLCSSGSPVASKLERWLTSRRLVEIERSHVIADLIHRFEQGAPDLVIADVSEGQYEHLRVAQRLRQRAGAHTVLVSAGELSTDRPLSSLTGVDAILFQPLTEAATVAQMQLLLQLVRARRDLHEAHVRLDALARSRQNGLALLNPDGDLVFHNQALARMFGYTSEQLQRIKVWDLATPAGRRAVRTANYDLHDDPHGTGGVVTRWQRRDGQPVEVEIDAHRFFDGERVDGLIFEARDIAEELALRQIVFDQPLALVDATMLVSRLEELREDVEALDRMTGEGAPTTEVQERVASARVTLERLMESNLPVENVDLAHVVRDVLDQYARHAQDQDVLTVDVPDGLPPVHGRAAELRRIVANFLADAVASVRARRSLDEPGEVTLRATLEHVEGEPRVVLSITDNGLPADHFARFDNRARIRLDRARSRISLWGGAVHIRSIREDAGAVVRLELATSATATPRRPEGEVVAEVLLVEDEVSEHQIIGAALQRVGYRVTGVADARAAERVLQERRFDVIIVDSNVPELASERGIRRLHDLAPAVPVILIGESAPDLAAEALPGTSVLDSDGIDAVLTEMQRVLALYKGG